jgi:YidC/Oxa1 family membrane protein insertase
MSRRHGTPKTEGYYILHEGYLGVFGDQGLKEDSYKNVEEKKEIRFKATNAWLGFTDKYWATTLLPDTKANVQAAFSAAPPAR